MPTTVKPAADYRTAAPREDGWTYQRQAIFLEVLSQYGVVAFACEVAEMSPASAYALRREARGRAFALGWQAAHLLARDRLEDVLLEAAVRGVETATTRIDGAGERTSIRTSLNGNLSMAVLNRLDRRAAALDDASMAVARSIGSAFEEYLGVILGGGTADDIAAFLEANPDPLARQVAAYEARHRTEAVTPAQAGVHNLGTSAFMDSRLRGSDGVCEGDGARRSDGLFGVPALAPQLVDESAIFSATLSDTPCDCHADRAAGRLVAA